MAGHVRDFELAIPRQYLNSIDQYRTYQYFTSTPLVHVYPMHPLLDKLYKDPNALVQHQIDIYNDLIDTEIGDIVANHGTINVKNSDKTKEVTISLSNIEITKPIFQEPSGRITMLYPEEARLRNLTYAADVMCTITMNTLHTSNGQVTTETLSNFKLCKFPIMVKSKYCHLHSQSPEKQGHCPYDYGGYFIVNGSEKVVIAQERMASNTLFIFDKGDITAEMHSMATNYVTKTFFMKYCQKTREINCSLPFVKQDIPLIILLRALGMTDNQEICTVIDCTMASLRPSLHVAEMCPSEETSQLYIAKFMNQQDASIANVKHMLIRDLLPHCSSDLFRKAVFVCHMVRNMFLVKQGKREPDDRDNYAMKRIDFTGSLLGSLFKTLFKRMMTDAGRIVLAAINNQREVNLQEAFKGLKISNGLKYSLATGNWGDQKNFVFTRIGVSQVLNRYNCMATLSHLRRINTPVGREGKLAKPRLLHNSQWGMTCPSETPEGQACGLLKNMAMTCIVSKNRPVGIILDILRDNGVQVLDSISRISKYNVLVNGAIHGFHNDIHTLATRVRAFRRNGYIHHDVSISIDKTNQHLVIYSDYGRLLRPLQIGMPKPVDPNQSWNDLLQSGVVEYLDSNESDNAYIAMYPDQWTSEHTHCEIDPSTILGTCASNIPFPDHNQAPRNTYQAAMGKQAIGFSGLDFLERMDTISNVLHYPQKPLVKTDLSSLLHTDNLPVGDNAIVAVISRAFNQEDSILMNQAAVDRGLFRSTTYHTYTEEEKRTGHLNKETIEKPAMNRVVKVRKGQDDHLDSDGMCCPGQYLPGNSIIVGKTTMVSSLQSDDPKTHDISCRTKHGDHGIVDKVMVTTNSEGSKLCKVRMRSNRIPEIGDKFASRHGQKGTIGLLVKQEDMPFTKDGIVPDIVLNPHAIPSRMTIGHLLESLLGKACALEGTFGNATPFNQSALSPEEIGDILVKHGFSFDGTEEMYDGTTGELMDAKIFICPVYYQRLKHMVADKIHARARGPLQILSRQPTEGRSRQGGLRTGDMEVQCCITTGLSEFIKDRLMYCSDVYTVNLCKTCGLIAQAKDYCKACDKLDPNQITKTEMPYAAKLLMQELMSMGVNIAMKTTS